MRLRRLLVRGCTVVAAGAALLVGAAQPALAYWTAPGSGSRSATIGTLAAPSIASATAGAGTVALSWSTVAAPASGTVTYYVSRDGGAASAACPSSSTPSSATSCTDSGVSVGRHQYTVTAVWRSWTATSATATAQISFGPVSQLVLTRQPAGAVGATAFTTQPVVTAEDAAGNTVTTYAGTVALSIKSGTGAAGAALTGCSGVRSGGVTTFSGCKIDKVGTGYQVRANDGTLTIDSTAFNVAAGAVSQLVFTTQPAGAAGASAFTTQPVVTAQDAAGNTVTTYAGTVALSIKSGTGAAGAALTSCSGVRSGGVTTFSGCKIDKAGTAYQLRASDGTLAIDSTAFNVTAGAVSQLVFTTQPAGAAAGSAFTTQPVVTAEDAAGNTVTTYAGTVALSIKSGTGAAGAALTGCSGVRSGGVTTFSGCKIDKVGTGYQVRANDGTLTIDSTAFNVAVGAASQLVFTTQPAGAAGGAAFATQPVVTAEDAAGNTVTTYAGTVTLSIKSGTGAAGAALTSCSGVRSGGVTTFSGCKIDKVGTGYQLRANDGTLTIDSTAFNVSAGAASQLVLSAATATPTAGTADNLTITALDAGGNTATAYTGTHNLRFNGAGTSPDGTQPTVTSSSGNAVVFGTTESISFSSGVATVSGGNNGAMTLHKAETASITVTDGTIGNGSGLSVTVAPGAAAQLAWTHVSVSAGTLSSPCLFSCTDTALGNNGTFTANVSVTDADGNAVSGLGTGHTVTVSTPTRGGGSGGSFIAPTSGSSVTLTISSTGAADSTALFTFKAQSGSWFFDTFSVQTATGTSYTSASATVTKQ